jgi:phosphoglycerate dehydrogenase-like enzyme
MLRIAVLDDFQGVALTSADWSVLNGRAEITVFRDNITDQQALAERLKPFEVLCVMRERTPLDGALLEQLPALKLIVSTGRRNASIDTAAAGRLGVQIANTESTGSAPIEMTWALILAAMRHIPEEVAALRAGRWQSTVGTDLSGATLGVVGLGHIGGAVARIGAAFRMKVIAWSQNLTPERAAEVGATAVSKDELFRRSDIVSLHLVLGARTRGVVGAAELALMKPTAWLVNTSRGPLVEEAALISALEGRRIAGAALDVFDVEPPPQNHPFRRLPNVIATPHLGFVTRDTYAIMYGQTVEAIVRWLDGRA